MSLLGIFDKQPDERESYSITYEDDLTDGDNVESAVITSSPAGLTISAPAIADPRVRFWISGGVDKTSYKVTVKTTTADGRVLEDEVKIKVKDV